MPTKLSREYNNLCGVHPCSSMPICRFLIFPLANNQPEKKNASSLPFLLKAQAFSTRANITFYTLNTPPSMRARQWETI